MAIEVTMPRMSDTMEQGTVVKWHVKVGDEVSAGDVLADIETDKATMELEAFDDGTIAKLAADEGSQISVGELIVVLAEDGESVDDAASSAGSAPATKQAAEAGSDASAGATTLTVEAPSTTSNGADTSTSSNGDGGRIFASPLARKIANEQNINLSGIQGTGPSGRIVKRDLAGAAASPATAAPAPAAQAPAVAAPAPLPAPGASLESKTVALSNMRATIARRLVESKTTIPHYQVSVSARMEALGDLRAQLNEQLQPQGVKLSVNDFIVRATALAMHEHPYVNSSWVDQGPSIQLHGQVNVGVAVALPEERGGGLVVATIRNADQIGLRQISAETKRLAKKARDKGLTIEEMSDSTFTISNLGMFGVDHFTAIVNPPNAAIMAVGRAIEKPFVEVDEETGEPIVVVGSEMTMTLSSDHRIIDGAMAAQYLTTVKNYLENPATMLV